MNLTTYFIKHPVVSLVLNAMIILLGMLCFNTLSVREFPQVNFPTVNVRAFYPNASPELVESAVTNILEDKLAGVEGLNVMKSQSKQGSCSIELNFRVGTSLDRSLVAIRDAVGLAKGDLPKEVKDPVIERKTGTDGPPFMVVSLESTTLDFGALTHYANLNIKNVFRSLKGVASAEVWGQPYTYEILLDPQKMVTFGVNADEIYEAISRSHVSLPVGKFKNEIPTTLNAELKSVEDYESLLIREKNFNDPHKKQHPIFLKSVADIVLKTDDQQFRVRINGNPGLCIGINRSNDANPLEVSNLVHKQVEELQETLPEGIKVNIVTDQGDFIRASLKGIQSSILEAMLLVLVIVFLFLRNFRATLIPLITIPISLIGALLFLKIFGYSINIITLLAMVLAVGLVVDDAIVVLENISRHIENGLSPLNAALKGSKEIGFAIVAMTLTLTSVYAPIAFIQGTIGQLFIEFAVALAGSVLISGIVALTLSPLMCAKTLKSHDTHLWPQVDVFLSKLSDVYGRSLNKLILRRKTALLFAGCSLVLTVVFFKIMPHEMAPKEDRALVGAYIPLIPGKTLDTLEEKVIEVEDIIKSVPETEGSLTFMGYQWGGNVILPLKSLSDRKRLAHEIVDSLRPLVSNLPSLDPHIWSWDSGLPGTDDTMGGNQVSLVISTIDSYRHLFDQLEKTRETLEQTKKFQSVSHDLRLDSSGYRIDVDTNLLAKLNLTQTQVAKMIEIFFSGDQSLTFPMDGLLYPITLKGKSSPWTLNELYVTNRNGTRISIGAVANMIPTAQPKELAHYNQMRSATLNVEMMPDQKIESVMPQLLKAADTILPQTYKKTWTGMAKAYNESSMTMIILFVLALVFVYAILSIQFENFVDPCIVLLTVPLACSGALFVAWMCGQSLNIYTQVGLITLIGLITKHGILIVEFTNQLSEQGHSLMESVTEAAHLRLRPILMTTGAMIFGAIPLVISHDAGFESRQAIGAILIGGLSFGTVFTLFIIPTLTYAVKSISPYK